MRPTIRARIRRFVAGPVLVAMLLLGTLSGVAAADLSTADRIVLATEADPDAPPPGLDPKPAGAVDDAGNDLNPFDPEHAEPNFLWGASVGLGVLMAGGFAFLGLLYWLMVLRPEKAESSHS